MQMKRGDLTARRAVCHDAESFASRPSGEQDWDMAGRGWIQETGKQERGQPCPPELDLKPGTRGHGCPRSDLESALRLGWAHLGTAPAGPRTVPVRSAWSGTKSLTFCSPP